MKTKTIVFCIIILLLSLISSNAQVLITDDENATVNPSAMLEIKSTDKGLLIPRMTTAQRNSISNPTGGLLVFDSDEGNFYIYGEGPGGTPVWNDLSTPSGIWQTQSSNVFLSDSYNNLGLGTTTPGGKLVIKADAGKAPDDPLLEIQDSEGNPVFVVTSEGARLYIKEISKGVSGGFAVGKYGIAKGIPDTTYFVVSPDSTRVYTVQNASGGFAVGKYGIAKGTVSYNFYTASDSTRVYANDGFKGASGGFAVGKYGIAKDLCNYSFYTAKDSTRVYADDIIRGVSGGFAVGKYGIAKDNLNRFFYTDLDSTRIYVKDVQAGFHVANTLSGMEENFMRLTPENYFIGHQSGNLTQPGVGDIGKFNVFMGYQSGLKNISGKRNVFLGYQAGSLNNADFNVFIGDESGLLNVSGISNTFVGYRSGLSNTGSENTFLGYNAGVTNSSGAQNTFLGKNTGASNVTGNGNTLIGYQTGISLSVSTANYNTMIGHSAGLANTSGNGNVFIGYQAGFTESGSNKLYIANTNSKPALIYGDFTAQYVTVNDVLQLAPRNLAPSSPLKGMMYFNGSTNKLMVYDGTTWQACW